ncbi:Tight junction protein ZO-2 [Mactra antiquata]
MNTMPSERNRHRSPSPTSSYNRRHNTTKNRIRKIKSSDNVVWETHKVGLTRVPGFGFGIAVSGGRDNPHFANGDPSIAISDVLKAGPAEGKLQINDRVLSVNGISLENVDHSTAISVLKDSGSTVHLVIRRRIVLPASLENETPPLKVTLSKRNRKDEYGVVLGCRFFIKEIIPNSLAAQEGGLKEGDSILKINSSPIESVSLVDAKKLLEKSKDKIQLIITKKRNEEKRKDDEYSLGYGTMQSIPEKHTDNINLYRPHTNPEENHYKAQFSPQDIPPGAYPSNSTHSRYDGRYIYDHEAVPPRPPLPSGIQDNSPMRSGSPTKDGYYSDREDLKRQKASSNYAVVHDDTDIGLLRRHHEERYVGKRKDIRPDPRACTFRKDPELGLGLRLAGGNSTGIFIASVQPGSEADKQGVSEGDHILKANDKDIAGSTREEAVTYLTSLEGTVTLVVQYKKEDFDRIMTSHEAGDSFYVRTHFNHEQREVGELSFVQGDIFHIKDTLFRGVVGSWLAVRMGRNNIETQKGIIPNKNRAEQLAISSQSTSEEDKENSPSKSRGLLFKRKAARRSKSLSKDHWEDVIFSHLQTKFPAYERVVLKDPGFVRPVVIFGPLADVARERILNDFSDRYQTPQSESHRDDEKKGRSGIIRLGAIKDVISRRKHCLLDVTPHNVDRLNFAQFYPIVVFLKSDCKTTVKELRTKWAKGSSKNPKKLYEQSLKLDKFYQHLFTATVTHNSSETWYKKLLDMIDLQQQQQIWMSEKKPDEDISDDYLFPMSNRLSFSGNQESDTDLARALDDLDGSPTHKKRLLVRSSSDPSVNTTDRIPGIPPYPDPPRYQRSPKLSYDGQQNYQDVAYDDSYTQRSEDRYYPSFYAVNYAEIERRQNRAHIDPYATLSPVERIRGRISSSDSPWNDGYDDRQQQQQSPSSPDPLYSRPFPRQQHQHQSSTQHEPSSPTIQQTSQQQQQQPPSHLHDQRQQQQPYNDNSSYSSDSFTKYTSNPANKHDDSKLREKFGQLGIRPGSKGNDPYRFTRSTANKVSTSNVDKSKLSDLSAKFRPDERLKISSSSLNSGKNSASSNHGSHHGSPQVSNVDHPSSPTNDGRPMRKQPPPVPIKTYHLKDRGIEPDDQKIRNYENTTNLRGYEYREGNTYSQLPRNDSHSKSRSLPNSGDRYADQPVSPSEHYKAEDPYEWVAPRQHSGYQRRGGANRHSDYQDNGSSSRNQNGRSFNNEMYMDYSELMRMRQERERERQGNYGSPADRPRPKQSSRNSRDRSVEKKRDDREFPGNHVRAGSGSSSNDQRGSQAGSAFEAYNKPMSTFGKNDLNRPKSPKKSGTDVRALPRFDPTQDVDENHTVVATARGVFTSKGGILESPETGVSIVIPDGAIDDNIEQEIYFKVCRDNTILPPLDREKGETLLSPLVMCGPHGLKFNHPVELRLPHCASVNPDSWSFALKSSDSPTGHPTQWQNMTLAEREGNQQSRVGKNSVSVLVDHF